ncbi:hypothetical protein NC651_033907 [Populus alba x Populus x berolinensis]|nr:hypothetical protein NC651_033907 [Populus alba x Populus x berolinensis]
MYQARVLGACLHINGFAVVKIDEEKGEVMETCIKTVMKLTCSFYDQLLQIQMPENSFV